MSSANTADDCSSQPQIPMRASELARLELAKLSVEAGVTLAQIIHQACESCATVFGVSRIGVWILVNARQTLRCFKLYEANAKSWSEGAVLQVADFPEYFNQLYSRKIVPAEAAQTDPKTSELVDSYLKPMGITSILDAPIFIGGEVVGVLCCEHTGPQREWTTEERDFVASVADLLAGKYRATQVKRLQATLEEKESRLFALEKSDALAKMALGVAHDFRNVLASIVNSMHAIEASANPAACQEPLSIIAQACEAGGRMVEELIDYGRNTAARPEALSPQDAIRQFMPILQTATGSEYALQVEGADETGKIFIDRQQFNRVLLNLVINAKDASTPGGSIKIRTDLSHQEELPGTYIVVEVCDSGRGMDMQTQQQIFEPFFSTKSDGSGLGMAIVQRIVDRAGGFIRVDSQPGSGTKIRVHLPRVSISD